MIDITIDGREIKAKANQTILQAARENKIKIPHLCFHPALKPAGTCKLCCVEVISPSGKHGVMLSCLVKVKNNMVIKTNSDILKEKRRAAFNKLLQMAPESERIRRLAAEYDIEVTPPPNGCIRCKLCIRVCSEIVKASALKMEKTKDGSKVVANPGRCIGCGTCANLCPTNIIKISDKDNVRTVSIKDEIIGQLPLVRCEACHKMFATTVFLQHVEEVNEYHTHTREHHNLCPECAKMMSTRALTEKARIRK